MTTRREWLKLAAAAPAAALYSGRTTAADEPKPSGTLYFGGAIQTGPGDRDFQFGLVTLDLKGGTWSVLNLGNGRRPRLSPDGKSVTYVTRESNPRRMTIWLADTAGGEARKLVAEDEKNLVLGAQWMPDGRSLIYTRMEDFAAEPHRWSNWVIGREGGEPRRLEAIPETDYILAVAPDGRSFVTAMRSRNPGGEAAVPPLRHEIFVVQADGSGRRRLMDDVYPAEVKYSPDGRRLALRNMHWKLDVRRQQPTSEETSLLVVDLDGNGRREVLRREGLVGHAWSPDGRDFAIVLLDFQRDETGRVIPGSGDFRLAVIPAGGGEAAEIATPPIREAVYLDWR